MGSKQLGVEKLCEMKNTLAIIIPAYKSQFFRETLESIASQTNRSFRLYIGDDCSPNDIYAIIQPYYSKLDIVYKRFETNLGKQSLVKHWERCIDMSIDEEWIWLFSDDDLMESTCVEKFYNSMQSTSTQYSLYRFNNKVINGSSEVITFNDNPDIQEVLAIELFLQKKFNFKMNSFACEYIFSRKKYTQVGGFIDFPVGWCSDDSMWCKLGNLDGISTITGSYVYWRLSNVNISSVGSGFEKEKIEAILLFFEWLKTFMGKSFLLTKSMTLSSKHFLFSNIINFRKKLTIKQILYLSTRLSEIYEQSRLESIWDLCKLNLRIR